MNDYCMCIYVCMEFNLFENVISSGLIYWYLKLYVIL